MAQNPSNVIPDQLIVVEGGKQLVPAPSSGDSGKVLGVLNSDGDIGWTEDREGMAQQQADWAETDPSKVTFIAHKPSGQMAPASTSSDSGKVLKVDSQGAPVWGDAPAGIVEFDWSTVTLSDIEGAITAGKTPVMLYVPWDNAYTTKCSLQKIEHTGSGDNYVFVSTPEGFVNTPSDQSTSITRLIMMYDGSKGSDIRSVSAILSSSDGSVTMAQGVTSAILDLSVANPLPASTSADEDKVLTVNSSGTPEWADAQGGGGGSEVGGPYVVNADPEFTSVTSLSAYTTVGYDNIYYELVDSTETRQVAAVRIPSMTIDFTSFADRVAINQNFSESSMIVSLKKVNTATNTVSFVSGVSSHTQYVNNTSSGYSIKFSELLFIPSSGPLPVLGENEKYVIVISSRVGSSPYIYPSRVPSRYTAQVYFYSASEKVVFNPITTPVVRDPLFANPDFIMLKTDPDKGMVVGDNFQDSKGLLTLNNTRHGFDFDNYTENPNPDADRMDIVIPLQDDWYSNSGYQKRFPAARMFQKFGGQNHGTYDPFFMFQGSGGPTVGDVYVVHIEAPATSTASGDHVAFCYFTLCETVEDWEAGTSTQYYHNFVLPGIYRSNMGGKFMADGTITISGSHSNGAFSSQIYSGPDIIALESGVTITPSYGVDGWNFCVSKI